MKQLLVEVTIRLEPGTSGFQVRRPLNCDKGVSRNSILEENPGFQDVCKSHCSDNRKTEIVIDVPNKCSDIANILLQLNPEFSSLQGKRKFVREIMEFENKGG